MQITVSHTACEKAEGSNLKPLIKFEIPVVVVLGTVLRTRMVTDCSCTPRAQESEVIWLAIYIHAESLPGSFLLTTNVAPGSFTT